MVTQACSSVAYMWERCLEFGRGLQVVEVQFKSLKPAGREVSRKTDESAIHDGIGEALSEPLGRARVSRQAWMCWVSLLKGTGIVLQCNEVRVKP
ncbi:unnamed protein product [Leuciscus chuanchicus]